MEDECSRLVLLGIVAFVSHRHQRWLPQMGAALPDTPSGAEQK